MANELSTLKDMISGLAAVVDSNRIYTDTDILDRYGEDTSLSPVRRPDIVVKALTTEEVQEVVKFANENRRPVIPRSSGIGFYGAGIPEQGGSVLEARRSHGNLTRATFRPCLDRPPA